MPLSITNLKNHLFYLIIKSIFIIKIIIWELFLSRNGHKLELSLWIVISFNVLLLFYVPSFDRDVNVSNSSRYKIFSLVHEYYLLI